MDICSSGNSATPLSQYQICPNLTEPSAVARCRAQNDPISVIRKPAEVLFVFPNPEPTNIPCLEQSDAITVNCYQNNNTKTVGLNPVWLIIGCWIILLDLFLVLLSAHSVLADVPVLLSAHRSF